jgi:hypothetical protein
MIIILLLLFLGSFRRWSGDNGHIVPARAEILSYHIYSSSGSHFIYFSAYFVSVLVLFILIR